MEPSLTATSASNDGTFPPSCTDPSCMYKTVRDAEIDPLHFFDSEPGSLFNSTGYSAVQEDQVPDPHDKIDRPYLDCRQIEQHAMIRICQPCIAEAQTRFITDRPVSSEVAEQSKSTNPTHWLAICLAYCGDPYITDSPQGLACLHVANGEIAPRSDDALIKSFRLIMRPERYFSHLPSLSVGQNTGADRAGKLQAEVEG